MSFFFGNRFVFYRGREIDEFMTLSQTILIDTCSNYNYGDSTFVVGRS